MRRSAPTSCTAAAARARASPARRTVAAHRRRCGMQSRAAHPPSSSPNSSRSSFSSWLDSGASLHSPRPAISQTTEQPELQSCIALTAVGMLSPLTYNSFELAMHFELTLRYVPVWFELHMCPEPTCTHTRYDEMGAASDHPQGNKQLTRTAAPLRWKPAADPRWGSDTPCACRASGTACICRTSWMPAPRPGPVTSTCHVTRGCVTTFHQSLVSLDATG